MASNILVFWVLTWRRSLVGSPLPQRRGFDENVFAEESFRAAQMACGGCQWRGLGPPGRSSRQYFARQKQAVLYSPPRRRRFRRRHQRGKGARDGEKGDGQGIYVVLGLERRGEVRDGLANPRPASRKIDHPRGARDGAEEPAGAGVDDKTKSVQGQPASPFGAAAGHPGRRPINNPHSNVWQRSKNLSGPDGAKRPWREFAWRSARGKSWSMAGRLKITFRPTRCARKRRCRWR